MAIAYVAERGTLSSTGSSGVLTVAVTGTVTAGNHLIAVFGHDAASLTIDSLTDTQGNAWAIDRQHTRGASFTRYVCSAKITTQLTTADSVTLDLSATRVNRIGLLQEFSGLATSSHLDQVASADGSSTSLNSGATSTTTQADELLIGAFGAGTTDTTFTPGTDFLTFTNSEQYAGQNMYSEYRIVSATGTYSATCTQVTNQAWCAIIATYKAAAVAAETQSFYAYRRRAVTR